MAKLFVVSKERQAEQKDADETSEISGDAKTDTEGALRALAFLIDFVNEVGPDELRRCADEIRAFRGQR